jgi:hypothetical protein
MTNSPTDSVLLHGTHDQYIVLDDNGTLYIQDTVASRDGTQLLPGVNQMTFVDGTGRFDDSGTAEHVSRLYSAALHRAADKAGLDAWTGDIDDSHHSLDDVANSFASSPEFIHNYGTLNDHDFVQQLYQNVLSRAGDPDGVQAWQNALASGLSRGQVVIGFADSAEDRADTRAIAGDKDDSEIYRLYTAAFNRVPDQAGQNGWSSALTNGATLAQIAHSFIESAEFQSTYGTLTARDFVSTLYTNALHRPADAAGLNAWTTALQQGATRESVLVGFSDSLENRSNTAGATHDGWVFIHA